MSISNRIRHAAPSSSILISLAIAALLFAIAYDNGSYSLPSRNTLAIAIWWAVIIGVALGVFRLDKTTRGSLALAGVLAALAAWTFASSLWSPSVEASFNEFNRVALFLGVFVLTVIAARREAIDRWSDGLALAASAIAFVAIVSRFFPGTFSDQGLGESLPSVADRLSFPTGYWNGLAIFVALGVPLLLRAAVSGRRALSRALPVVPIPAIVSVVFLASSRGGLVAGAIGIGVFLALTADRWRATMAVISAAAGSAVVLASLLARDELVNKPNLNVDLVESQGGSAMVILVFACLGSGLLFAAIRETSDRLALKPRPWLGWSIVSALVAVTLVAALLSHPGRQFESFKQRPTVNTLPSDDFARAHLLSASGSGRWQFWDSSLNQFAANPVLGDGAGSYESWWLQHTDFYYKIKDAHSLYLESLGELGVAGFALVLGIAVGGIGLGVARTRESSGEQRVVLAALTGAFAGYAVAAGIDWMWELSAVTIFALVVLGLISIGSAPSRGSLRVADQPSPRQERLRKLGLWTGLVAAWFLICAQGIPLLSQLRLKDSRAYVQGRDYEQAIQAAMDAKNLQPWASSPYLQLALVTEKERLVKQANSWIEKAIDKDPRNWQLWIVDFRIELKLGNEQQAERSLRRAYMLNPQSPVFSAYRAGELGG